MATQDDLQCTFNPFLAAFIGACIAGIGGVFTIILIVPFLVYLLTRKRYPRVQPGSIIVVTGASSGIGKHAALTLAQEGYLVIAGVRKAEDGQALKVEVGGGSAGVIIIPIILDIRKQKDIDDALAIVTNEMRTRRIALGGIVNNAGVTGGMDPVEYIPMDYAEVAFQTNYFGALRMIQTFAPFLRQHHGRIINVTSMSGCVSRPLGGLYSSTKFALEALSDALRMEMIQHQVSVSVIQPAYTKTDIFNKAKERLPTINPAWKTLYGHLWSDSKFENRIKLASEPSVTSSAILHALEHCYPHTRYKVANMDGVPAWLIGWALWISSDRLKDVILTGGSLFRWTRRTRRDSSRMEGAGEE